MAGEDEERQQSWLRLEMQDDLDEELEMELDDERLPEALRQIRRDRKKGTIDRQLYFRELLRLQSELVNCRTGSRRTG